jgi:predicted nuclease of predicted toxin-antitoxin system
MKIVVDESVSYGLAAVLRSSGHVVTAIAEATTTGAIDRDIYNAVVQEQAILITRDFHFTNALRYPPEKTGGIIYIRPGNLKSSEEIEIVQKFLSEHSHDEYDGHLVTLYGDSIKIR